MCQRSRFRDLSLWFLLFSNIVTISSAIFGNLKLATIVWVYWFQSVIIGFFNFIRILQLKELSIGGLKVNFIRILQLKELSIGGLKANGLITQNWQVMKFFAAFFFLFHFGSFHLAYLIFLAAGIFSEVDGDVLHSSEAKYILLNTLLFFINHLFSYFYNKPRDTEKEDIGSLMFYPYIRIIPMHVTIILVLLIRNLALPLFFVLKTLVDIKMHIVEHNILRRRRKRQAEIILN